ncbi:MAG: hypothetical protein HKM05_09315 [Spirochaetales bacterium]|nr:hypothetical protein [Spirochaetales bacterium]
MKTLRTLVGSLVVAVLSNSWLDSISGCADVVQLLCLGCFGISTFFKIETPVFKLETPAHQQGKSWGDYRL